MNSTEEEECAQVRGGETRFLITGRQESKNVGEQEIRDVVYRPQGSQISPGPKPSMHVTNLDTERPVMGHCVDGMPPVSQRALAPP